jgi:hypothetical protein
MIAESKKRPRVVRSERLEHYRNGTVNDTLLEEAIADIKKSGLDFDLLKKHEIKIFNGTEEELFSRLGFTRIGNQSLLDDTIRLIEFPYFKEGVLSDYNVYKTVPTLEGSDGKSCKYIMPKGKEPIPYILPEVWLIKDKVTKPLWITEGCKKALKLFQHGRFPISITGVWNFKTSEWEDFNWKRRTVYLGFDSDYQTNPNVRMALYELAFKLYSKGAILKIATWSKAEGKGIDDYLSTQENPEKSLDIIETESSALMDFILPDHHKEVVRALTLIKLSGSNEESTYNQVSEKLKITVDLLKKDVNSHEKGFNSTNLKYSDKRIIPETEFPFEIFPNELNGFIHKLAESCQVPPILSACCTLPIIGSAIGNALRISPRYDWSEPPFIWLITVALSGDGKSPVINKLMEPINKLQQDAYKKYKDELRKYEKDMRMAKKNKDIDMPEEPKLRQYHVTDFTTEVLVDIFHDDPHGILIYRDELSGLFLGMNQYKGGKGNDKQQFLELYNCKSMKVDRKNKVTCAEHSGASIIGGVQPRVMVDLFQENSFNDGLVPRFLTIHVDSMCKEFSRKSITNEDLKYWSQLINWCYGLQNHGSGNNSIQAITLELDNDAQDVFADFFNSYNKLKRFLSPKAKVFIPKFITYCLRLTGVLHAMQTYPDIDKFNRHISVDTITDAIKLTKFFAGQMVKCLELYQKKSPELDEYQKKLVEKLQKLQITVSKGRIKLELIVEEFNNDMPETLQHTPEKIQSLLVGLGLKTKKCTGNFSYLIWEQEKMAKLFSMIPITSVTSVTPNFLEVPKEANN